MDEYESVINGFDFIRKIEGSILFPQVDIFIHCPMCNVYVYRNKLKELCVTAQTLVEDHCVKRANSLFDAYKQFYRYLCTLILEPE